MNNSYITIIKEERTDLSRKRVPLNQNECTANFRTSVPFEQNLQEIPEEIEKVIKEKQQKVDQAVKMLRLLSVLPKIKELNSQK